MKRSEQRWVVAAPHELKFLNLYADPDQSEPVFGPLENATYSPKRDAFEFAHHQLAHIAQVGGGEVRLRVMRYEDAEQLVAEHEAFEQAQSTLSQTDPYDFDEHQDHGLRY